MLETITILYITLPAPDDPANSNKSLYTCASQSVHKGLINFFILSDQDFSLVIVLSLFLIFGQISA